MINIIESTNPTNNTAPLPLQTANSPSDVNVQYLVAKALAEMFKTDSKDQPSDKQQLLDAIEQQLATAAAANNGKYDSIALFWKNLMGTLPSGSPLQNFAKSQWQILTDNPELEKWQTQLNQDTTNYNAGVSNDAQMQQVIDSIQNLINYCQAHWYNPACLGELIGLYPALGAALLLKKIYDAAVVAPAEQAMQTDKGIVARLEQQVLKQSTVADQQYSQTAGAGLSEGKSENDRLNAMLDQFVGLQKVLIKMDQIQS